MPKWFLLPNCLLTFCNFFSHQQLLGKNQAQQHELLHSVGINWADYTPTIKNGSYVLPDGEIRSDVLPTYENIAALIA